MKKIIMSLAIIAAVGAIVVGATTAFFSDSETSTGNVLAAGTIDLKIDNESYITDSAGRLVFSSSTSWDLRDLTIEKFFDFSDIKPGDIGEDTISLHVNNNDSWLCVDVTLTADNENTLVDPEADDGDVTNDPNGGELADQVTFIWWADDGDNVLETDETTLPGGPLGALAVGQTASVALADSGQNIWDGTGPLPGASDRFIGKGWCFGAITQAAVTQDNLGKTGTNGPLVRGTGFTCNGVAVNNTAQTDSLTADITFRAVQSRNNANFLCSTSTQGPVSPVVDGIISAGEYDNALSMAITNAGGGTVKAKTQGGFLYLAADIITDTTDNRTFPGFNDEFGVNLGESPTTDTAFLGLGSTNANGRTVGTIDGYFTNFATAGHSLVALFTSGHRVIEWKMPLSVLPSIVNGDTLSIGGATESTDGNSAVYPIGLVWGNNATYGQLLVQ